MSNLRNGKMLKSELRREALRRIEESARTVSDFQDVAEMWDKLDANRERKERYHEFLTSDNLSVLANSLKSMRLDIDLLDIIFDSPETIHELVTDEDIAELLYVLSMSQKEILYYRAVKLFLMKQIAEMRGQSERYIRKIHTAMLAEIRSELYLRFSESIACGLPITTSARKFLERYKDEFEIKIPLDRCQTV